MKSWPGPKRDAAIAQACRHRLHWQHGAVSDVAGHDRFAVADDRLADSAPKTIGTNQRGAAPDLAAFQLQSDAGRVLGSAGSEAVGLQLNAGL
jgi:hypothetical protein